MAKSDSFFIRAKATTSDATFQDTAIDLGFAVDALGKSVLRIHNIQTETYDAGTGKAWSPTGEVGLGWNLTTQQQTGLVNCTDKSLISSGITIVSDDADNLMQLYTETANINPSNFTNGYLVAVEQIYLGVNGQASMSKQADVCLMIECTVETMTSAKAMALSLSQQ